MDLEYIKISGFFKLLWLFIHSDVYLHGESLMSKKKRKEF